MYGMLKFSIFYDNSFLRVQFQDDVLLSESSPFQQNWREVLPL